LRRSRTNADRRIVVVELTPHAIRRERTTFGPLARESAKLLARFTAEERTVIAGFLRVVRDASDRARERILASGHQSSGKPSRIRTKANRKGRSGAR